MKICVCVKQAIDENELKFDSEGNPLLQTAPTKISTFDKNAVEEALRIKSEKGGEVYVFSLGTQESKKAIREALAMGADKAVLINASQQGLSATKTSFLLASAIRKYGPFDIVLLSEGSSDTYTSIVPGSLAAYLGYEYLPYARKLEINGNEVVVSQALEDISVKIAASMPAVVSVVSEINQPRYPTLIQIMQASKKQIEEISSEALGSASLPSYGVESIKAYSFERKKVIFEGEPAQVARKLVDALRSEGLI